MKKFIVTATRQGKISTEAEGFQGPECITRAAFLENALGTVESRTEKPEMHELAPQTDTTLEVQA